MTSNRRTTTLGLALALLGGAASSAAEPVLPPPMVLANDESWFRLAILGCEFPDEANDYWDANWLMISGSVRLSGRNWAFKDPCLTTFEALSLATWLEACADARPDKASCTFTEPVLQFELSDPRTLRVSFALEGRPPWGKQGDDWRKYGFNIPVGPSLVAAASALRGQLGRFPVRGSDQD